VSPNPSPLSALHHPSCKSTIHLVQDRGGLNTPASSTVVWGYFNDLGPGGRQLSSAHTLQLCNVSCTEHVDGMDLAPGGQVLPTMGIFLERKPVDLFAVGLRALGR